jgi:mannose-6-phosphate isomerase class I
MGDHPNGPSMVKIDKDDKNLVNIINNVEFMDKHDGEILSICDLLKLDPVTFLGHNYLEKFAAQDASLGTSLTFLFKVLSVRTALSI